MNSKFILLSSAAFLSLAALTRAQNEGAVPPPAVTKFESGVIYSRGDYGLTEDTTVFVVPVTLSYESGPWTWRASVPWLSIDGPANVIGEGAGGSAGPVRPVTEDESGIGDSTIGFSYKLASGADRLNAAFTARVKLPTGDDERGIGTGETDTYAQFDLFQTFGTITPFGSAGYRWLGDGRYQLENGLYVSGGLLFTIAAGTSVGLSYEWREAIVAGGDDASEATLIAFRRFNERWSGTATAMKGFTDASADHGFSLQLGYSF
jgi:hypothetical protein